MSRRSAAISTGSRTPAVGVRYKRHASGPTFRHSPPTRAAQERTRMIEGQTGRRMRIGTMPSLKKDSLRGGPVRYRDIKEMALTAEALGFDSFWLADHLIFRNPDGKYVGTWEGFTLLSALA